jgi:hypothetical protein
MVDHYEAVRHSLLLKKGGLVNIVEQQMISTTRYACIYFTSGNEGAIYLLCDSLGTETWK